MIEHDDMGTNDTDHEKSRYDCEVGEHSKYQLRQPMLHHIVINIFANTPYKLLFFFHLPVCQFEGEEEKKDAVVLLWPAITQLFLHVCLLLLEQFSLSCE